MDIEDIIMKPSGKPDLTLEQKEILKTELIKNTFESTFHLIKYIQKTYKFIHLNKK